VLFSVSLSHSHCYSLSIFNLKSTPPLSNKPCINPKQQANRKRILKEFESARNSIGFHHP
jgi:hypothetical protein